MAKFSVTLKAENIGPHHEKNAINAVNIVESNKAIIFAVNGTGKSFISRSFRLAELPLHVCDDLLTISQNDANFKFSITGEDCNKMLGIHLERGKVPVVANNSGFIFHVFNSDYVTDNIRPNYFTPNGDMDGYILGKLQIDLSEDRGKEKTIIADIESLEKHINGVISDAKQDLHNCGVVSNTTELALFSTEELKNPSPVEDVGSYMDVKAKLNKLGSAPEALDDINSIEFEFDTSYFDKMEQILITSFPPSTWDGDFVKYYKENKNFIEHGLERIDSGESVCPFCKRAFDEDALKLIKAYAEYKSNQESQIIGYLNSCLTKIRLLPKILENYNQQVILSRAQLDRIKEYYPSLADYKLSEVEICDSVIRDLNSVSNLIEKKIEDISVCCDEITGRLTSLKMFLDSVRCNNANNNSIIEAGNRTKNRTKTERLKLRRKLCKAKYLECVSALKDSFDKCELKRKELKDLRENIREKEELSKISKREKVYSTLTDTLDMFFNGKYSIDRETFQVRFLGNTVGAQASRILSDGEKSIVAYCYYLATTHLLVERESDYNRLFFIIDDPISSMDFHYVYVVAQSIRGIRNLFHITDHERIWVFTHNLEFFRIVTRNHILSTVYSLRPGKFEAMKEELLMPYESHLRDIVQVSKKEMPPSHTTANSIRHVIETVCRFEYPNKKLEDYIDEDPVLSKGPWIQSMCQDLSHGAVRYQPPYTEEVLVEACNIVIKFISEKYKGQIDALYKEPADAH